MHLARCVHATALGGASAMSILAMLAAIAAWPSIFVGGKEHATPPWCTTNPLMGSVISPSSWHETEAAALRQIQSLPLQMMEWVTNATDRAAMRKRTMGQRLSSNGGSLPEGGEPALGERWRPFAVTGDCHVQEYPKVADRQDIKVADGSKWLCRGLDEQGPSCVVYSIGSNDQWDFEEAIFKGTQCTVFTFDCTITPRKMPDYIKKRVKFHNICVGSSDRTVGGQEFRTLGSMMRMLGHDAVTLLKMDVEGYEYDVLYSLLRRDDQWAYARLPHQISIELHYQAGKKAIGLGWYGRYLTVGELANLAQALYWGGYRIVSSEVNPKWPQCIELTLVRYRCP